MSKFTIYFLLGLIIASTLVIAAQLTQDIDLSKELTTNEKNRIIELGLSNLTWELDDCYEGGIAGVYITGGGMHEYIVMSMESKKCDDYEYIKSKVSEHIISKVQPTVIPAQKINVGGKIIS